MLSIILSASISSGAAAQAVDWPICTGNLQTAEINVSINSYGEFLPPGATCGGNCPESGPDCRAFETPTASGITYLWAGGIWVGGIVNGDTLVSASRDNTFPLPDELSPARIDGRGITRTDTPGDIGLRAEFYDTATAGAGVDPASGRVHIPLNLRIVNRAHVRNDPDFSRAVVYDMVITNIGSDTIHESFVAIYLDADILGSDPFGYEDDMIGSLPSSGIGYAVDNDGDPGFTDFTPQSPTRLIALTFLQTSFVPRNTNFNWWRGEFFYGGGDFGPRRKDTVYHDYGTGSTGDPIGDRNKYLMMSFPEWDYDQCYVHTIGPDNDRWLEPPTSIATDLYDGGDMRFLMSIGPFDLAPDSSARIIYAIFTGRWVHRDPAIMQFLPEYPDLYRMSLNMSDIVSTAEHAQFFAEELMNPLLPPTGVTATLESEDSVVVSWDPWGFDHVTGYNIDMGAVSLDALPYPGVFAPWLRPDSLRRTYSNAGDWSLTFTSLSPDSFYFVAAGHQSDTGPGAMSEPIAIRPWRRQPAPSFLADRFLYTEGNGSSISWHADPETPVDHFNIYRFSTYDKALGSYHPFYSTDSTSEGRLPADTFTVDDTTYFYYAMQPYSVVGGTEESFTDSDPCDGCYYVVSTADRNGFESWFSSPATTLARPSQVAEIGVFTFSAYYGQGTIPSIVEDVYVSVLSRYTHEIRFLYLPENQIDSTSWWRELLKYKLAIIDDGFDDYAITMIPASAISTYLGEGGQVLYCGSFFRKTDADRLTADPLYRAVDGATRTLFGVDSVFQMGLRWYADHTEEPLIDSVLGFSCAEPEREDLAPICYDSVDYRFAITLLQYWPHTSPPIPSTFRPTPGAEILYRFRSLTPQTSRVHGDPCALMLEHGDGRAISLGAHLWYMDTSQARSFIDWVMERSPTGIADSQTIMLPLGISLAANYPNPFNPTTTIEFSLPAAADVRIDVYNVLGQQVSRLQDAHLPAGHHSVEWDGRTDSGDRAASGVYFYRLKTDGEVLARKMLLLR